jgi:hypothetical protein
MIHDTLVAGMRVEQLNDLIKAGFDIGQYAEKTGRAPSQNDIFNMHRDLRSVGNPSMRSPEQLFEDVSGQIEGKFGIQRRVKNIDANRKRGVADRMKQSANSHGTDLDEYQTNWAPQSRQPNLDMGAPATAETIAARDRRDAGEGGEDLTPKRKSAFDRFFAGRGGGTDRRPGAADVRLSRTADDRRYPDLAAAG